MNGLAVTAEQRSLLGRQNHSFKPLSTAGYLPWSHVGYLIISPLVLFLCSLLLLTSNARVHHEQDVYLFRWLLCAIFLVVPTATLVVFIFGVLISRLSSRVRWSAALYWGYWPFWKCLVMWAAALVGLTIGNAIWYSNLSTYHRIGNLQVYFDVDPVRTSGFRLQDAGLAVFLPNVSVDRGNMGCFKADHTYCIAPISLKAVGAAAGSEFGDFFMAGRDCCSCPGDFRCGDWNAPAVAVGGIRVLDSENTDFFRLAVDKWKQASGHAVVEGGSRSIDGPAVFFEWVTDPVTRFKAHRIWGMQELFFVACFAPLVLFVILASVNLLFYYVLSAGYAAPTDVVLSSTGGAVASLSKRLMPQMHNHQQEHLNQLNAPLHTI
eukprot:TRINITY_DN34485_c0_g1_i1.p1 TRINITY_DN34485_c0_g1~~TRINITY_DN34485_c0_g1_i1.p1  ORF type:complete len:378 (+),score=39.94 TRINITY_DN34485_c0_g1_i1:83-1216(+)